MSLLMEALKKADEAKRRSDEDASSETPLQPSGPLTPSAGSPLPNLSQHLDAVNADLAAVSAAAPPRRPAAGNDANGRAAARNAFAAKRAPETGKTMWIVAGAAAFATLVIAGYFWWQLRAIESPAVGRPPQPPVATAPVSPAPAPLPPTVNAGGPQPSAVPSSTPVSSEAVPETPARSAFAAAPPPPARESKPSARSSETPRPEPSQNADRKAADAPLRLTRTTPRTASLIERAYEALQEGKADEAQRDYEQVLRADGKSTDALLGLATLAAQQGQVEKAHGYYLRALESDPSDPTARAGVLSTRGQADVDSAESRLKTALAGQPDSPPLLFALGNLYARQARWSEAQQAYFQAYAAEPDNPDVIFNLAVSLDHLRQGKLAAQYYRMALNAGESRKTSFDPNQVRTRLLELQP